jgi:serine-type D-Ala-D-Ala carboxypeptidase/endopeptidase (penicillin-binding protein 4)
MGAIMSMTSTPLRSPVRWRSRLGCLLGGLALGLPVLAHATIGTLPVPVRSALQKAGLPAGSMSALVVAADGPAIERLRHRSEAAVNPASVMKLVTTYAAIDLLGPDYTWNTEFYTDGEVFEGVLRGNLYVRGGGDPKLVLERLQEAFIRLQEKGVR